MTPQVSIITPSFNQAPYLRRTIESVLQQQVDLEYIIIDGCSTDGSIDILKEYENDAQVVIEKDEGQSDAIAKGFSMAKGDILAWLNSDDIYFPGTLAKVVDAFSKGDEFVYGNNCIIDTNDAILRRRVSISVGFKELYYGMYTIPQESTFFSKKLYQQCGGLNKHYEYAMDYDLWLRMALIHKPIMLNDFLSGFRYHQEQKSRNIVQYEKEKERAREALSVNHSKNRLLSVWYNTIVDIRTLYANIHGIGIHNTLNDLIKKKMGKLP